MVRGIDFEFCLEFYNCQDLDYETVKIQTLDWDHVQNWDLKDL